MREACLTQKRGDLAPNGPTTFCFPLDSNERSSRGQRVRRGAHLSLHTYLYKSPFQVGQNSYSFVPKPQQCPYGISRYFRTTVKRVVYQPSTARDCPIQGLIWCSLFSGVNQ